MRREHADPLSVARPPLCAQRLRGAALDAQNYTHNVLCSFCGDGHFDDNPYDDWATRLPHLQRQLAAYDADLIGLQELVYTAPNPDRAIDDEVAALGGRGSVYASIYYERDPDDPRSSMDYPDATILYKTASSRCVTVTSGSAQRPTSPSVPDLIPMVSCRA